MSRIAITTFHNAENYGAALQCKALYTYLTECGNNVEIIDYRCSSIENAYRLFPKFRKNIFKLVQQYISVVKNYRGLKNRKLKFQQFLADFKKTTPMNLDEICNSSFNYDLVIAGSDQIWNPKITNGLDKVYFLGFDGCFHRAGYAISLGDVNCSQFESQIFCDYIKKFDYLSFRESDTVDFIESKIGRRYLQVVDPTLLLTREQWDRIIGTITFPTPQKYILVYYASEEVIKIAEQLSKRYGLPILNIKMNGNSNSFHNKIKNLLDVGPIEFLFLIRNASMVVTSSFHGAVLSCIYQKDLSLVMPKKNDSRVTAIANLFQLHDRVYSSYNDFIERCNDEKPPINNNTLEYQEALKRSVNYLREITNADEQN